MTISQYIKNRDDFQHDCYLGMASFIVKYRERYLDVFIGPSVQQIFPDYNIKRSLAAGGRIGLTYYFSDDRTLLQAGAELISLPLKDNEEGPPQDYKINSKVTSVALTFGYRL